MRCGWCGSKYATVRVVRRECGHWGRDILRCQECAANGK
jgi:hypothetical protein